MMKISKDRIRKVGGGGLRFQHSSGFGALVVLRLLRLPEVRILVTLPEPSH